VPHPAPLAGETPHASREVGTTLQAAPSGHEHEPASARRPHLTPAKREAETSQPQPQGPRPASTRQVEAARRENHTPVGREANIRRVAGLPGTEWKVRELEARVASLEASRAGEGGRRDLLGSASGAATPTTTSQAAAPTGPAAAAPHSPSRGVERRDEPPHVTVTIGRVDVRAVFNAPPAAAHPPAPRAAQKTTLADYLKQRERGRR